MAMSPSSLLAKLDELKRWQQVQQERLLKQHQTQIEAANSLFPHLATLKEDNSVNNVNNEDNSSKICGKPESEKINLSLSPQNAPKPFLKRGTGLAKYGLQYGDHQKPFNKMKAPKVHKTVFHKRINEIKTEQTQMSDKKVDVSNKKVKSTNNCNLLKEKPVQIISDIKIKDNNKNLQESNSSTDITPLRAPDIGIKQVKLKAKWCPVEPDDYEPLPVTAPEVTANLDYEQSEYQYDNQVDDKQNYENTSDLSAQQNIQLQMLQNNPALFQVLQKLASDHFGYPANEISDQTDFLSKLTLLDNESTIYQTPSNNNNTQLVLYLQELLKKFEHNTPGDLTSYENALEKELRVFEQLEQKAMNSSFCSTNSSVLELLASTPNRIIKSKVPSFDTIQEGCNAKANMEIKDDKPRLQDTNNTLESRSSSNAKKMLVYNETSVQCDYSDESSINSDDFERTTGHVIPEVIVRQNASTMTDNVNEVNEEMLKVKLQELEAEILSFRSENKKIEKSKCDLERERSEFQRAKKNLEKELLEKREELECEIEEERKKLHKERLVFEKYSKDMQNKPNRKEREEISNLKAELCNVKETLKVKETRNGTTQARLRTQIKSLEKDNGYLKEEIEKLQKTNARLQNQTHLGRKTRQDENKMLHEINKNLTKLTQDQKVAKALNKLESSIEEKLSSEDSLIALSVGSRKQTVLPTDNKQSKTKANKSVHPVQSVHKVAYTDLDYEKSKRKEKIDSESSSDESDDKKPRKTSKSDYKSEYSRSYSRSSYNSEDYDESRPKSRSRSSFESRKSMDNKENESSNGDITTFRNLSDLSVCENYEKVFGVNGKSVNQKSVGKDSVSNSRQLKRHNSLNDTQQTNKVETILADGSKETKYVNGNVKIVSPDGDFVKMEYFNGDIKETVVAEGTVKYFYKETQIWQTTFSTGDETFEFPDGQVEKHFADGSSHVQFPNGIVKHVNPDGSEQINYPDGSVVNIKQDGERILLLPNGQKEIHTDQHKRREYPDGTVKIIYTDGLQETRYSNGRIRMKDKDGNLIMDSHKD